MICKSFSSEQKTAPLRDGFRTVQTRFYPLYLLDPALEADLPGTRAKPSHEEATGVDAVRDETTCQSATLLFQRGEESFCAGTESDPGGRPSREADPRPAVPPSFQECVWETQGRVQQPVNNWEQLPPLWADWPRWPVITLARTCCCFISATLLLRNNDGN